MNHKAQIARLLVVGFALSFPALLVLGAVRLTLTQAFLRFEYTRPGFPSDPYGFSTADRLDLGFLAIDYLLNGEGIEFLGSLALSAEKCWPQGTAEETCPMFSEAALGHMKDVKQITNLAFAFGFGLAVVAWSSVVLGVAISSIPPSHPARTAFGQYIDTCCVGHACCCNSGHLGHGF